MNMGELHHVAFFVYRHLDRRAVAYVFGGAAWAVGVQVGFPDYVEVWGMRR